MRRTSVRRSSIASRLLTTLSARPISRPAADRLPAATIRTNVRSSVMSSSMPASRSFPIDGEYLQFAQDNIPHRVGLVCRQSKGATPMFNTADNQFHLSRRETLRTVGAAAALAIGTVAGGPHQAQAATATVDASARKAAGFWPNGARLAVSLSLRFKGGGQPTSRA